MAYIERRKLKSRSSYRAVVKVQHHPRRSATFATIAEARQWAIEQEAEVRKNVQSLGSAPRPTFSDAVTRYLRDVAPRTPKSFATKRRYLKIWCAGIGGLPIVQVSATVISEFRDELLRQKTRSKRAFSSATVNRYLATLSHVLTIAANEWGWIEHSPMPKVTRLREPRGRTRYLSEAERSSLLEACRTSKNDFLYPIVVLAISTGMRRSEILNLRWSDIDFSRERAFLSDTKNGDSRAVHLVGHAKDLIAQFCCEPRQSEYVFPSKNGARIVDFKRPWKIALKQAAIFDFRFHDLRHCTASYLAMNGATLPEIAEVLGHKTLAMVQRYTHLSDSHVKGVVASMNRVLFP